MKHTNIYLYILCIGALFTSLNTTFANDSLEVKKEIWQSSNVFEEKAGKYSIANNDCDVTWEIIEFKNKETGIFQVAEGHFINSAIFMKKYFAGY